MSTWDDLGRFIARVSSEALTTIIEAVRTVFEGDPETRRRVAFSIAMIALSAKMAKADGFVTQNEVRAFEQIFTIPENERQNVHRLYSIAMEDIAGFEAYAQKLTRLCGSGKPGCAALEDILDGLFYIATADEAVHDKEVNFLRRVSEIFGFTETQFEGILARHIDMGDADPYRVLGVDRSMSFEDIRREYRRLVRENHPDMMIARGVPPEFVSIANEKLATLNDAWARIEKTAVKV